VVRDALRVVGVAFIGPGEGCQGGEGGAMAGEGGWLQWLSKSAHHGGLRHDMKRAGSDGGASNGSGRHLEVRSGGTERPSTAGLGGGAIGVGRRGVEERADKRGPCISEGRDRRRREWKA
jgi:hypothetical protein